MICKGSPSGSCETVARLRTSADESLFFIDVAGFEEFADMRTEIANGCSGCASEIGKRRPFTRQQFGHDTQAQFRKQEFIHCDAARRTPRRARRSRKSNLRPEYSRASVHTMQLQES